MELRRYFTNTSWILTEKVIRLFINLSVGIYVATFLGPANFGLLSYSLSFVILFSALSTLSIEHIIIRDLVNLPASRDSILGTAFRLKLAGALAAILLVALALSITPNPAGAQLLIFIIASGMIFQSFDVIDFYFQSKVLSKYVVFVNFIQTLISASLKLYFVFTKASLIAFASITIIESLILAMGLFIVYNKQGLSLKAWKYEHSFAKQLLQTSLPLIFANFAIAIYLRIDQIMINEFRGIEATGNYAIVVTICEAFYALPAAIISSLFPAIIEAKKNSPTLYHSRLQKLYNLMVMISVPIAILITLCGEQLVLWTVGGKFVDAIYPLKIYIWAGVFYYLGIASGRWLIVENFVLTNLYRTLSGAVLNVALNFILIPKYGITGAAWSTLATQFFAYYAFDLLRKETLISFKMKTKALFYPL